MHLVAGAGNSMQVSCMGGRGYQCPSWPRTAVFQGARYRKLAATAFQYGTPSVSRSFFFWIKYTFIYSLVVKGETLLGSLYHVLFPPMDWNQTQTETTEFTLEVGSGREQSTHRTKL